MFGNLTPSVRNLLGNIRISFGDLLYGSRSNTLVKISGNTTTTQMFLSQTGTGSDTAPPVWSAISGSDVIGEPLTKTDDANVTLTLGGTPATSLLQPVSLTLGWAGLLPGTRGGTGVNNGSRTITMGGNVTFSGAYTFTGTLTGTTSITFPTSGTLATDLESAYTNGNGTISLIDSPNKPFQLLYGVINAFKVDPFNEQVSTSFPMLVPNGAEIFQSTKFINSSATIDATYVGYNCISDGAADHVLTISATYFSTNADDSFSVMTRGSHTMTVTPGAGVTINGSSSNIVISNPYTMATFTLQNPTTKAWACTFSNTYQSSADVTITGENYLTLTGQQITANAVNLSGTNVTGTLAAARFPALTGDLTTSAGSLATTLASVNSNLGGFGSSTQVGTFTVNAKGLITAASNVTISGTSPGGAAGGDLTGTYPNPTIAANAVTYAKFQQVAASSLVGNPTGSLANAQAISLGVSLQFSGTTLNTIQNIRTTDSPTFIGLTVNTITSAAGTALALTSAASASGVDAQGISLIAASGIGGAAPNGGTLTLTAGNGGGSSGGIGGSVNITAGNAPHGSTAGAVTIQAGTSTTTGGVTNIYGGAGNGSNAAGGQLNLIGGAAPGFNIGGNVVVTGGSASALGIGGDVIVSGGPSGTTSLAGNLRLRGGLATSGTQGAVIFDQGLVNMNLLTASNIVMTDSSKNLVSLAVLTPANGGTGNSAGYAANDTYFYTVCGGL